MEIHLDGLVCCTAGNTPVFPRIKVWDQYKRLDISPYASEEEVWRYRNFLLDQYAGHEISEESVEEAFERLLITSFQQRKKSKINLKTKLKEKVDKSPPCVKKLLTFVQLPPMDFVFRRLFLFSLMGGWSIMNSAEGGPWTCFSVSLVACTYFLNEKTKSLGRAFVIGIGALATGWIMGSITFSCFSPTVQNSSDEHSKFLILLYDSYSKVVLNNSLKAAFIENQRTR
ncbi:hypothetical protein ACFE04_006569 [Oxalis oulophora]